MSVTVAVIGHVEWVTHARGRMPQAGEITHLVDPFDEPAGGGAVVASQVAALGERCLFYTALGDDRTGQRCAGVLGDRGVDLQAVRHPIPQPRALSVSDADGERAIAVVGEGLGPTADDPLPWRLLGECDAAYFTGHDPDTLRAARAARILVVSARRAPVLARAGVVADVVVGSATDAAEQIPEGLLEHPPTVRVVTEGEDGGRYVTADGRAGRWAASAPSGPPVDSYGCGDGFAAGLTVGLARGLELDAALALGARCGAQRISVRGAFGEIA